MFAGLAATLARCGAAAAPQALRRGGLAVVAPSRGLSHLAAPAARLWARPAPGAALGFLPPSSGAASRGPLASALGAVRQKQTKRQSYRKDGRSYPCARPPGEFPHIGVKALTSEYVEVGRLICKQRKFIAKNPNVKRKRHFKIYPGVNVKVMKSTSLQAAVSGRVKMTHDITRGVMIMNVLPEPREELLRDELWRYRTEHVTSYEENTLVCQLRSKALVAFGREWVNQPTGMKPMRVRIAYNRDTWNNPHVQDPLEVEPFPYPMPKSVLARHIRKVRARQQGVPDEENDPDFHATDPHFHKFRGQAAQR